jgi:hypothetical protein
MKRKVSRRQAKAQIGAATPKEKKNVQELARMIAINLFSL